MSLSADAIEGQQVYVTMKIKINFLNNFLKFLHTTGCCNLFYLFYMQFMQKVVAFSAVTKKSRKFISFQNKNKGEEIKAHVSTGQGQIM